MEAQKSARKTRVGTVISNKMDKTIVVRVERLVHHPKYHKFMRRQNKFTAHDAHNVCLVGDRVLIEESRPLSKTKRWVVVRTIEKAVM
jgi:small subunit ribosomal protein S17